MDYKFSTMENIESSNEDESITKFKFIPLALPLSASDIFYELEENISKITSDQLRILLIQFQAALISTEGEIPDDLKVKDVGTLLRDCIDPKNLLGIIYEAISTSVTWTGIQSKNNEAYEDPDFFHFLYIFTLESLSNQNDQLSLKKGCAGLALIKNILAESEEKRNQFVEMDAIEIYSILFNEFKDQTIRTLFSQLFINLLKKEDIPLEKSHFIVDMYVQELSGNLNKTQPIDFYLLLQFSEANIKQTIYFLSRISIKNITGNYLTATTETRSEILRMLAELVRHPSDEISRIVNEEIDWNTIIEGQNPQNCRSEFEFLCVLTRNAILCKENSYVLSSNVIPFLSQIVETAPTQIHNLCLSVLRDLLLVDGSVYVEQFASLNIIKRILRFLENENTDLVEWALKILLVIVDCAQKFQNLEPIVNDLMEFGYDDIENDAFAENDLQYLYEIFVERAGDLIATFELQKIDEENRGYNQEEEVTTVCDVMTENEAEEREPMLPYPKEKRHLPQPEEEEDIFEDVSESEDEFVI